MSLSNFKNLKLITKTQNYTISTVKRSLDNQIYTLKSFLLNNLSPFWKKSAFSEIQILSSINHKNIISFKEAFFDEPTKTLNLITEFHETSLQNVIMNKKLKKNYFSEKTIWNTLIQLLIGINYLHKKGIIHQNLKSSNIFCFDSEKIKIGNFASCKIINNIKLNQKKISLTYYTAPEIRESKTYDFECDIWSIGCIIYEMATLGDSLKFLYENLKNGKSPKIKKKYSTELQSVINNILVINPENRPTASELLNSYIIKQKIIDLTIGYDDNNEKISNDKGIKYISNILPKNKYNNEVIVEDKSKNLIHNYLINNLKYDVKNNKIYDNYINNKSRKNNLIHKNVYKTIHQRQNTEDSSLLTNNKKFLNKSYSTTSIINFRNKINEINDLNSISTSNIINNNVINIMTNRINFKNQKLNNNSGIVKNEFDKSLPIFTINDNNKTKNLYNKNIFKGKNYIKPSNTCFNLSNKIKNSEKNNDKNYLVFKTISKKPTIMNKTNKKNRHKILNNQNFKLNNSNISFKNSLKSNLFTPNSKSNTTLINENIDKETLTNFSNRVNQVSDNKLVKSEKIKFSSLHKNNENYLKDFNFINNNDSNIINKLKFNSPLILSNNLKYSNYRQYSNKNSLQRSFNYDFSLTNSKNFDQFIDKVNSSKINRTPKNQLKLDNNNVIYRKINQNNLYRNSNYIFINLNNKNTQKKKGLFIE